MLNISEHHPVLKCSKSSNHEKVNCPTWRLGPHIAFQSISGTLTRLYFQRSPEKSLNSFPKSEFQNTIVSLFRFWTSFKNLITLFWNLRIIFDHFWSVFPGLNHGSGQTLGQRPIYAFGITSPVAKWIVTGNVASWVKFFNQLGAEQKNW